MSSFTADSPPTSDPQTFEEIANFARWEHNRFRFAGNIPAIKGVEKGLALRLMNFMRSDRASTLDIITLRDYWPLTADLCLFAPAHFGYSPSGLLGVLARLPLLSTFFEPILAYSTAYNDLQAGSPVLLNLQRATEGLQNEFPGVPALRASVLWGQNDRLVSMGSYALDALEASENRQNHTSICKPTAEYRRPLHFVQHGKLSRVAGA